MSGADDEYTPATPEHVLVFPPGTVFTEVATTSEQFFREYCPSTRGYATRFFPHRINAVIHGGRVFFPGTPPSTSSGRTRGISVTSPPDENTPVHGNAINGPGPNDDIGPMSERDPGIENAVNPNFNDDICDNVLAVVNMSANTSIYSPPALSSRRSVHLYMPELTRTSCTTQETRSNQFGVFCYQYSFPNQVILLFCPMSHSKLGTRPNRCFKPNFTPKVGTIA